MEAKDLRLGNYVNDYGMCCEVTHLMLSRLVEINNSGKTCINLTAIPLTEDWLVRFGLIKRYEENQFEDNGFTLDENGNKYYAWVDDGVFSLEIQTNGEIWFELYSYYRHIEFVHELQNLYYALTKRELVLDSSAD